MRLVSFARKSTISPGILFERGILPLSMLGYDNILSFIAASGSALKMAQAVLNEISSLDLLQPDSIQLLAPVPKPPKILCVGLNYRDHAIESKMQIPEVPTVFVKLPNSVTRADAAIRIPSDIKQPDYEAELAVVIGKRAEQVSRGDWQEYVFGYTILNDISARDVQLATSQWTLGKSLNTFAPMGPWIVTRDEIPDPHALEIRLSINGELLQHSNTRNLIFGIPELIEYISHLVPLEPGDIISTGTPAGVGLGRKPPRWLAAGDKIVIEIEKIGMLKNSVEIESIKHDAASALAAI